MVILFTGANRGCTKRLLTPLPKGAVDSPTSGSWRQIHSIPGAHIKQGGLNVGTAMRETMSSAQAYLLRSANQSKMPFFQKILLSNTSCALAIDELLCSILGRETKFRLLVGPLCSWALVKQHVWETETGWKPLFQKEDSWKRGLWTKLPSHRQKDRCYHNTNTNTTFHTNTADTCIY